MSGGKFLIAALILISAAANASAPAAEDPPKRLIQVSPTRQLWLSEREIAELSRRAHEEGHCGGFMDVTGRPAKRPMYLRPVGVLEDRVPTQQDVVEPLLPSLSAKNLEAHVAALSSFLNRYYKSEDGVKAAHWIRDRFLSLGASRTDITVQLVRHEFPQPSVIARIPGQGAKAKETVVLGAHEDSINWSGFFPDPNARAPGADDDASGVATLLEVFRVLAESGYRPQRTLEFIAYAGEERGLLGSQDIAHRYQQDQRVVAAVMQLDMTMFPGQARKISLINDHVDPGLTRFAAVLIDTYVKVPWGETKCGYACSDHASWHALGYPAVFPFEAPFKEYNRKIHTEDDTLAVLDAEFGLHFAKLALAFAVEMASGE